jgi:hypothetical protein
LIVSCPQEREANRFAKEHPSEGEWQLFDRLLSEMSKTTEEADGSSSQEGGESSNGTASSP